MIEKVLLNNTFIAINNHDVDNYTLTMIKLLQYSSVASKALRMASPGPEI